MRGFVDERFEAVREAFGLNFIDHDEIGASLCVIVEDQLVVDLAGGWADSIGGRPWDHDTLVNVFSIGKAMTATCAARLVGQGELDFDAPMARYWPEFAAGGKAQLTVAQVLSHRAGLPALRARLPDGAMFDWDRMTTALAAEEPWWPPGTAVG